MMARIVTGVLLVLMGVGGIVLGVRGWTRERDVLDSGILDVTVTQRETSPMLAALGGIALVSGIVIVWAARDRSPS